MKTATRTSTQWSIRPRQAGDFALYDDKEHFRGRAPTRQGAEDLKITLQKLQHASRQTAEVTA